MYGRGRDLRRPVGVGWCACDMTNIIHHVHAHLAGLGVVGWVLCRVVPTLSDLWGGVNGHGVDNMFAYLEESGVGHELEDN